MSIIEDKNHAENPNNYVKENRTFGTIKLPPGFRFQPTDQEIVFQYLVRKVLSYPLPASVVPEIINIFQYNPWDLPGEREQERYFFSKKEAKYGHGNRVNRMSNDGYWKATGFDKCITRCCTNHPISRRKETIIGMKKTLVFYKSKPSSIRTHWVMHEYRLVQSLTLPSTTSNDKKSWIQMGNWVLCHLFMNKRGRNLIEDDKMMSLNSREQLAQMNLTRNEENLIDCNEASSCSSSSSCGSSVVTHEVSSSMKPLYHEERN
ncbi:NAC domain-containing protein 83-like [Rutidosis leptorrhynchoides]|uniref:NAC domain-containing protein 83-like n=1 Tax=Rutidosis leptorrhynchoides TaxID=125765 RepID=UPI003A99BAD6